MTTAQLHMDPDPDDPELWLPYIDGAIDGRPHRFLLDTGAGQTRILGDSSTADLPVVGTKQSHGLFDGLTDELVVLKSLQLCPITKTDLTVIRTAHADRPSLVGMDVMGDRAMVLDLGKASAGFVSSGSLPTSWSMRRSPNGQPFLELQFPDVVALACWDTGAALTVVDTSFAEAHQHLFTHIGSSSDGLNRAVARYPDVPNVRLHRRRHNVGGAQGRGSAVAAGPDADARRARLPGDQPVRVDDGLPLKPLGRNARTVTARSEDAHGRAGRSLSPAGETDTATMHASDPNSRPGRRIGWFLSGGRSRSDATLASDERSVSDVGGVSLA